MAKKISLGALPHLLGDEAGLLEQAFAPNPNTSLSEANDETEAEEKEDKHLAKAVKNDNSAVRVKDWNFFLALGLSEKVRARNWKEAAERIRPQMVASTPSEEVPSFQTVQDHCWRIY
jgi:hypothetical protein